MFDESKSFSGKETLKQKKSIQEPNVLQSQSELRKEEKEQKKNFEKEQNIIFSDTKQLLKKLKYLVENGLISAASVEHIAKGELIDPKELEIVFEKIDEILDINSIKNILPQDLLISKQEYMSALMDEILRKQVLQKLEESLGYIFNYVRGPKKFGFKMFVGIIMLLDKNLQIMQGNIIDLKSNLTSLK